MKEKYLPSLCLKTLRSRLALHLLLASGSLRFLIAPEKAFLASPLPRPVLLCPAVLQLCQPLPFLLLRRLKTPASECLCFCSSKGIPLSSAQCLPEHQGYHQGSQGSAFELL